MCDLTFGKIIKQLNICTLQRNIRVNENILLLSIDTIQLLLKLM